MDVRSQWVNTTDQQRLFVKTWGDKQHPALVLVHGYPDHQEVWEPMITYLAKLYLVVGNGEFADEFVLSGGAVGECTHGERDLLHEALGHYGVFTVILHVHQLVLDGRTSTINDENYHNIDFNCCFMWQNYEIMHTLANKYGVDAVCGERYRGGFVAACRRGGSGFSGGTYDDSGMAVVLLCGCSDGRVRNELRPQCHSDLFPLFFRWRFLLQFQRCVRSAGPDDIRKWICASCR